MQILYPEFMTYILPTSHVLERSVLIVKCFCAGTAGYTLMSTQVCKLNVDTPPLVLKRSVLFCTIYKNVLSTGSTDYHYGRSNVMDTGTCIV